MGKKVISLSIDNYDDIMESCVILNWNDEIAYTDEYEVPYQVEILTNTREGEKIPDVVEIKGLEQLYTVIDKEDCLPDVGLLDYKDDDLGIDLKDVTLRELYKAVLDKALT